MLYLTTLFDKNYLSRGLVMYESLLQHSSPFTLYVLCLDEYTFQYFAGGNYSHVIPLRLSELEEADKELLAAKANRRTVEYFFTISPCLPLYLIKKYSLPHICSLDADILFFSDPAMLFDNLNHYSIVVTPHKFSKEIAYLENRGKFNVSFQIFKNDATGIACLEKWRAQCIEWCHDYLDEETQRYGDQKYLDAWISDYPGKVKVLDDSVSGLAAWNINNYQLLEKDGQMYANDEKIIFFHYHAFKLFGRRWASNGFKIFAVRNNRLVEKLYLVYWKKLHKKNETLNISLDTSTRQNLAESTLRKVLSHDGVFFYLSDKQLLYTNLTFLLPAFNALAYAKNKIAGLF